MRVGQLVHEQHTSSPLAWVTSDVVISTIKRANRCCAGHNGPLLIGKTAEVVLLSIGLDGGYPLLVLRGPRHTSVVGARMRVPLSRHWGRVGRGPPPPRQRSSRGAAACHRS